MSDKPIPTSGIVQVSPATADPGDRPWFDYPLCVYPHHTDYAGVVWHGTYIQWMEEARVEYFRSIGLNFAELVAIGCDLPVVDLSVRYHQPLQLGMRAILKTRLSEITGVRQIIQCQICSLDGQERYLTAQVTLVAIDRQQGKVLRKLPPMLTDALMKLS
ncbi:thioesterase family protein [Roseofilum sp. BLCC_M91]|uniref:Thioesterase family protein n=1 Tax=Roseofilum halophilum BLCC-M91 TaxID=3022259 RepID=A0ABT7BFX1_9CYAN|nr:thioesterase family protein [Roseofilum halophilum]MDJ1178081.1 thioesterase family protein [Roseofilum halophilum BLCC-M91]